MQDIFIESVERMMRDSGVGKYPKIGSVMYFDLAR